MSKNPFSTNDKVVCIDKSVIPKGCINSFDEFTFPNGYIEKGVIYTVESSGDKTWHGISLVGKPILLKGHGVSWNYKRFRKVVRNAHKLEKKSSNLAEV